MALRKWSVVEEELKKQGMVTPALLRTLGEMHERFRVQHEQIMQLATHYGQLIDRFNDVVQATGSMKQMIEKAGLNEKLNELEGDPDEAGSTWHDMREKKN